MNVKEIKEMINLMNENNLSEIEIERDGLKIKLKRQSGREVESVIERVGGEAGAPLPARGPDETPAGKGLIEIKAPMVGTFYRSPSPDAPPYVDVGSEVKEGEVICIIEAMKLMNEIKSELKGKVVEIQAENGDPVEFGQVLFLVEPE